MVQACLLDVSTNGNSHGYFNVQKWSCFLSQHGCCTHTVLQTLFINHTLRRAMAQLGTMTDIMQLLLSGSWQNSISYPSWSWKNVLQFSLFLSLPLISLSYFSFDLPPLFLGVPLSTQWGPQGYFYAIQIAQYGLSHYSKNLTERPPHVEVYDTAEERDSRPAGPGSWSVSKGCSLTRVHDKGRATSVRQFSAPGGISVPLLGSWFTMQAIWLHSSATLPFCLCFIQPQKIPPFSLFCFNTLAPV